MCNHHQTASPIKMNYTCDKCDFAANSRKILETHKKEKHESKILYICTHCKFESESKADLTVHMKKKHSVGNNDKKKLDNVFECSQFKEDLNSFEELIAHTDTHHKVVKYTCDLCDYQTNLEDNLKEHHLRVHTGKRRKDEDMGPSPNKKPCNFNDPLHSSTCCDRNSGYRNPRIFSKREKTG